MALIEMRINLHCGIDYEIKKTSLYFFGGNTGAAFLFKAATDTNEY